MSYEDGWAAINLEMPRRVPRTEYSAESHWDLVKRVTGIDVSWDSPEDLQSRASLEFMKAWDYSFFWSTPVGVDFGPWTTNMGHAVYAAGGTDWNDKVKCPFPSPEDVLAFDPVSSLPSPDERAIARRADERYSAACQSRPFGVNMTGLYHTCISGLIQLFGWDMLLLAAGIDPEGFGRLTNRYCDVVERYFRGMAASSVPVVMVHDDIVWTSGPFISPSWYREYVFPNYKRFFAPLIDSGKKIIYTSDGNYTMFLDDIVAAGVHGFCFEPLTDMAYFASKYGRTHAFIGNVDTRVLLSGPRDAIRAEVERCMAVGKGCPGFMLAVGNHIPPNTPVENALYYNELYLNMRDR